MRFKPPQPLASWTGVREAKDSAPGAYQTALVNIDRVQQLQNELDPGIQGGTIYPPHVAKIYSPPRISEDCLYLEIWAPRPDPSRKKAVYFYIHGGANWNNAASFPPERGENLAREEDIIVVRPNNRLGALGWVHFGLVSDDLPDAINLGLQDQIAALKWVHENIEAFGGDPENITVGGESCGATAVSHFLTNPEVHPYFRRAILQSLSPFNTWCTQERQEAETVARMYLDLLGIEDASELMDVDPDRLCAVANLLMNYFPSDANHAWRPQGGVIDGKWIPRHPAIHLATDELSLGKIEVMFGYAKDEWQAFRGLTPTIQNGSVEDVLAVLRPVYGDRAEAVFEAHRGLYPDRAPGHLLSDLMGFEFFKYSTTEICRNLTRQGITTYLFEYSFDQPGLGGIMRAVHTGDMPFIWRTYGVDDLPMWPALQGADHSEVHYTARAFGALYGNFIRSGYPGPAWRPFGDEDATLLMGKVVESVPHRLAAERRNFEEIGGIVGVAALERILLDNLRHNLASHPAR